MTSALDKKEGETAKIYCGFKQTHIYIYIFKVNKLISRILLELEKKV